MPNETDNDTSSIIPEISSLGKPKAVPKKTLASSSVRAAKPILEGINSEKISQDVVVVKPNLSPKEKELISPTPNPSPQPVLNINKSEGRLMPESVAIAVNKKNHHIGRWLLIFVVLLILVLGCYGLYVWNLSKGQKPILGRTHDLSQAASSAGPLVATTSAAGIASSTPTSTSTSSTTAAVLQLKINSTPTGFLNVRTLPSLSGKVITKVHPGEIYIYTNMKNNWYYITLSSGQQGWVSGQYVTKQN